MSKVPQNLPWWTGFPKVNEHGAANSVNGKICTGQNKDKIKSRFMFLNRRKSKIQPHMKVQIKFCQLLDIDFAQSNIPSMTLMEESGFLPLVKKRCGSPAVR